MDAGQTMLILSQLIFGAAATFLAIILWSKIRDAAWILIISGIILLYIEVVYSILNIFGISGLDFAYIGTTPLLAFALPSLRNLFFIAAFIIMIIKQNRLSNPVKKIKQNNQSNGEEK